LRPSTPKVLASLLLAAVIPGTAAWAAGAWETDPTAYTIRIDNPKVRVLEVHYAPGHRAPLHDLSNRAVIVKETARLKTRNAMGIEKQFEARAGEYGWEGAESLEIENIGTTDYRAIWVEIKS
jgi:hypothetical protein